nr:MAG TPA: RNA polymerase [Caudoviricetes sp.]
MIKYGNIWHIFCTIKMRSIYQKGRCFFHAKK